MTRSSRYGAKHRKHHRGIAINKLCAIAGIIAGALSVFVLDDASALLIALIFGVPSFFSRRGIYR